MGEGPLLGDQLVVRYVRIKTLDSKRATKKGRQGLFLTCLFYLAVPAA